MDINNKKVGLKIRQIRQNLGMTQQEFGDLFDATRSNVSKWERGSSLPNKERIKKVASVGNTTVNNLLYGNPSIEEILIEKLNFYIDKKRDTFKQEIKLLTESGLEGLARLVGRGKGLADNAVKDYEDHRNRIQKLEEYGNNYIKENYGSYSYNNFIKKFPNSNLDDFKEYTNNEWDKTEKKLDKYWETLVSTIDYYSWINSRFTDQIINELDKISSIAIKEQREDYYVNEIIQPFLDQAAKDFKKYIKENTDIK